MVGRASAARESPQSRAFRASRCQPRSRVNYPSVWRSSGNRRTKRDCSRSPPPSSAPAGRSPSPSSCRRSPTEQRSALVEVAEPVVVDEAGLGQRLAHLVDVEAELAGGELRALLLDRKSTRLNS